MRPARLVRLLFHLTQLDLTRYGGHTRGKGPYDDDPPYYAYVCFECWLVLEPSVQEPQHDWLYCPQTRRRTCQKVIVVVCDKCGRGLLFASEDEAASRPKCRPTDYGTEHNPPPIFHTANRFPDDMTFLRTYRET